MRRWRRGSARGELSLVAATQPGLFQPLGAGDARIDEIVRLLDAVGYERWLVLEQDQAITGTEPPVGRGSGARCRRASSTCPTPAPRRERVSHR